MNLNLAQPPQCQASNDTQRPSPMLEYLTRLLPEPLLFRAKPLQPPPLLSPPLPTTTITQMLTPTILAIEKPSTTVTLTTTIPTTNTLCCQRNILHLDREHHDHDFCPHLVHTRRVNQVDYRRH